MRSLLILFLKGVAMGAANVIPGVSGGTVALVAGIYQRLIDALRAIDLHTLKLVGRRRWAEAAGRIDLRFLVALGAGMAISLMSLARLLSWALARFPVETWAFFFGLILGSVWFVGSTVGRWRGGPIAAFLAGLVLAAGIAFLPPAAPNPHPVYLLLCGVAAVVSMLLPGLSGSYVMLLMGNYKLVLDAISEARILVLLWVGTGMVLGLAAFSRLISYLYRRHRDLTVALLTGFILGSLLIIWPWKVTGADLENVSEYAWRLPDLARLATWGQIGLILVGGLSVWLLERSGKLTPAQHGRSERGRRS
jgi:putative membrane protein